MQTNQTGDGSCLQLQLELASALSSNLNRFSTKGLLRTADLSRLVPPESLTLAVGRSKFTLPWASSEETN
jgi:hypothetical protein